MKPINDWNNVQAAGSIEAIPAGAYVCEIQKCSEVRNKNTPGTHLEILFDVCEGDYRGFFAQDWKSQDREDKFWRGIVNQNIPDENSTKYEQQKKFFKRFTNIVEDSNPGYHWDWNEAALKGKKIGIVFGEREKESQRGTIYTVTDAREIITVEDVRSGKYKVPEKRTIRPVPTYGGFTELPSDDELPFI